MDTSTSGEKVRILTQVSVNTLTKNPLSVTVVFSSRDKIVLPVAIIESDKGQEVTLALEDTFDDNTDYLVAATRSGEAGANCAYTLLAGKAPSWFGHPEQDGFNPLAGSDRMDLGQRHIAAMPFVFIATLLAKEKPRV